MNNFKQLKDFFLNNRFPILWFFLLSFAISLTFPTGFSIRYSYQLNDIANEPIIAPFDFGILKNQIGTFYDPQGVIVDPFFLNTLSENQILSGYAEIFKHSIISNTNTFNLLISNDLNLKSINIIKESIEIKNNIVLIDKRETKERKALNYGHTLGHAIESYFLKSEKQLLHGEAISIGIVLASFISVKKAGLSKDILEKIKNHVLKIYKKISFLENDIQEILKLLVHDKKNSHERINFVLIKNIGVPVYDIEVNNDLIIKAFKYYSS